MSELALFKRKHDAPPVGDVVFVPVASLTPREVAIHEAARQIFGSLVGIHTVLDIDDLFTEAQVQLNDGLAFPATRLHSFLEQAMESCEDVVLWYSSDYSDLPMTSDREELLALVEAGVDSPLCECYIHWRRSESLELCRVGRDSNGTISSKSGA